MTRAEFAARWGFAPDSPHLALALTHRSAASGAATNERLEFLGDALVGVYVARFLFQSLPDADEGTLSRCRSAVVRRESLANAARAIGLPDILKVAPGERKENRHNSDAPLADAFEAVVAALFVEAGDDAAESFVRAALGDTITAVVAAPVAPDAKTQLQVLLQGMGRGLPLYGDLPTPDGTFAVEVRTQAGDVLGWGAGLSKRAAQTVAAQTALETLAQETATTK